MKIKHFLIVLFAGFFFACNWPAGIFVETESFTDKGGWVVDQQFMDLMRSSYLLAHGMRKPVKDASTEVTFPRKGNFRMFVRTFNWTSPWFNGKGPGRFQVLIDGKPAGTTFGDAGKEWLWQDGGRIALEPYPELGGIVKELSPEKVGNAKPESQYEDEKKTALNNGEPNITRFMNYRAHQCDACGAGYCTGHAHDRPDGRGREDGCRRVQAKQCETARRVRKSFGKPENFDGERRRKGRGITLSRL